MPDPPAPHQGRGAVTNPPNRFDKLHYELDEDAEPDDSRPKTLYLRDPSRTLIASNDSPDVGFEKSINPYRGCEHGCVYCFARPFHEYLGFSSGLDFETKILVKEDAPEILRRELAAPSWNGQIIAMSGVTDPYQPIERKLQLTRRCLEVLAECRNPVTIITKNHLVTRDIDLLSELAKYNAAAVALSITSLDDSLTRIMEPRTSSGKLRIDAVAKLSAAGIPTGIMVAPVIPAINEHEIPAILKAAAEAGARTAGYVALRLPYQVKSIFEAWLDTHFPDRKEKVLNRVREMRGGELYDSRWRIRQRGQGVFADQLGTFFRITARKYGIDHRFPELSSEHFRRPAGPQQRLF